jgi:hypothetical protein
MRIRELDGPGLDGELIQRIERLCAEGRAHFERFQRQVRDDQWHPYIPIDYAVALRALLAQREPGARFLEWGSATGVVTIMADLLGFEAYGIELDAELVEVARDLAGRYGSGARFAAGSFLPSGYLWSPPGGDQRMGTIGEGVPGYTELGLALDEFDVVYGYPWTGEAPMMHDLMARHGRPGARLLVPDGEEVHVYRDGVREG